MFTVETCYAYSWFEREDPVTGFTSVNAWCLNKDSQPVLFRFEGYQPHVYIELPLYIEKLRHRWSQEDAILVYERIKTRLDEQGPMACKSGMYKTLYRGGAEYPMLKLEFRRRADIQKCENLLKNPFNVPELGNLICKVWESRINTTRQFLTARKCKYSQWFTAKGIKPHPKDKISTLELEYITDYQNLEPVEPEKTKAWNVMPRVLVIDIETYSDNHKAMPIRTMDAHVAYMISCIYQRIGDPKSRKKHLIVLGDCILRDAGDVEIIRVLNEFELCEALCKLIQKYDPEIISGYNILGFDYPYLNARLSRLVKTWNECASRLIGVKPEIIIPKKWESKAYGYNANYFIEFPGRISIDMLPIIRRGHKLPKYDLDTVGNAFLKRGKHDIKPVQMFEYYQEFMESKRLLEYCVKEWVGVKEFEKKGEEWINGYTEELKDELLRFVSNNDDKCQYIPRFHDNVGNEVLLEVLIKYRKAIDNLTRVGRYCVEDSELVIDLIDKTGIWVGLVELSNTAQIGIVDSFSRGQQMRGLSQMYDLLEPMGVVIDYKPPSSTSGFSGGFVGDPDPGMYDYCITLDFASLYPSIIMAFNICMSTYLSPGEEKAYKPEDYYEIKCPIYDEDDDSKIVGYNIHRFVKEHIREGYICKIVKNLINSRREVKRELNKADENSIEWQVLNERQLAYKVCANSIYGLLGVKVGGLLPCLQGAESVTSIGREKIQFCNQYLIDKYKARVVYNDTDSTFFTLPFVNSYTEGIEWGHKLTKELNSLMEKHLSLEFEKITRLFVMKKKKYVCWPADIADKKFNKITKKWDPNPHYGELKNLQEDPNHLLVRGIVLARRDNCKLLRQIYRTTLDAILNKQDMKKVLSCLMKECIKLYRGEIDWSGAIIVRSLGAQYKSDNYFMKVFGEQIKALGKPANPGDRLDYLICEGEGLLGQRMRLPETYLEQLNSDKPDKIDCRYYLEKLFMKSLHQLWAIGFRKELEDLEKQYETEDRLKIIGHIQQESKKDKGTSIVSLWNFYNGDLDKIFEWLSDPNHDSGKYRGNESIHKYLYNKYVKARQTLVSGRSIFNARITSDPIKQLLKAADFGPDKVDQFARVVLLPEDYKELFG